MRYAPPSTTYKVMLNAGRVSASQSGPTTSSNGSREWANSGGSRKKDKKDLYPNPIGTSLRTIFLRQIVACAVLALLGDLCAQLYEGTSLDEFDWLRMARFTLFRAVFATPVYIYWLTKLDRMAERLSSITGMWPLLAKLILDQGLYGPVYQVVFFCFVAALEGQPLSEGLHRCAIVLPHSIPLYWSFWLPAQSLNFLYVPLPWRVIYVNTLSIVWNTIMSLYNASAATTHLPSPSPRTPVSPLMPLKPGVAVAVASTSIAPAAPRLAGSISSHLTVTIGRNDMEGGAGAVSDDPLSDEDEYRPSFNMCADNWPRQCHRKANKCWSEWVIARCPRTCGLCETDGTLDS